GWCGGRRGGRGSSAPDGRWGGGPHWCVRVWSSGRAGGAGGCPPSGAGFVDAAGVKIVVAISAPHDHFAGPQCCVLLSASGRVDGAGGCPTISARIVSPAGVQMARDHINKIIKIPAPGDHFASC